jgi:hypothetical protein
MFATTLAVWIPVIGGFMSLLGILFGAWAVVRSAVNKENLIAYKDRVQLLEKHNDELKTLVAELRAEYEASQSARRVLEEMKSSSAEIAKLQGSFDEHHQEMYAAVQKLLVTVQSIAA